MEMNTKPDCCHVGWPVEQPLASVTIPTEIYLKKGLCHHSGTLLFSLVVRFCCISERFKVIEAPDNIAYFARGPEF